MVGNPPFLGGTMISTHVSDGYLAWLKQSFEQSGNRADLVAYFFRRGFAMLRQTRRFWAGGDQHDWSGGHARDRT